MKFNYFAKLLLFLFLINVSVKAQFQEQWVQRYIGPANFYDRGIKIAVDGSGNVYVIGKSNGINNLYDYITIKYNSDGIQQWVQRYNGPVNGNDEPSSLAVDGMGNVYVTGKSSGIGTLHDYATIKYNTAGVQQWIQRYNGPGNGQDDATSISIDGMGNIYVTGNSFSWLNNSDYATIKYNSAGVQQWVQRYNGLVDAYDWVKSISVDGMGNVYITGGSYGIGTSVDFTTIKYNPAGVQLWVKRYTGFAGYGWDMPVSLAVDGSGNVYVTGYSWGGGTDFDYATIKYNSTGVQQWVKRYNGPGNGYDQASQLVVDGIGNVYVTGISTGSGTNHDYATIKYNSIGVQQWIQRYNGLGNGNDEATSISVDGLRNVYVTGRSTENGGNGDFNTIIYNSAGVQQWVQNYNGTANGYDRALSLAIDGAGNVYVTGESTGAVSYDCTTIKYALQKYIQDIVLLSAPYDYEEILTLTPTLRWKAVSVASSYDLQVSQYMDFSAPVINSTGLSTATTTFDIPPGVLLRGEKYFWRVRAWSSLGISTKWSDDWEFIVSPVATAPAGITQNGTGIPKENKLYNNFPNPFNPSTKIKFDIPYSGNVRITVYDFLGKEVQTLANEFKAEGSYEIHFDASMLASGTYFYQIKTGEFTDIKKMVLIK